jgi:hypothetical protein
MNLVRSERNPELHHQTPGSVSEKSIRFARMSARHTYIQVQIARHSDVPICRNLDSMQHRQALLFISKG